ncbi:MAG: L,D-transpeptidase family protein [Armatimonadota bacterium]
MKKYIPAILALLIFAVLMGSPIGRRLVSRIQGEKTVADRLAEYGPAARERLAPVFEAVGVDYPPKRVVLAAFKDERVLEVYADSEDGIRFLREYPILGASGGLGPKLEEGDGQVPEGIYPIVSLNPNSILHLSLRIGYPNDFDRKMARRDGRGSLGGNIMIHGGRASIGCLAVGDQAAEDLFVLGADTGITNMEIILAPVDFRKKTLDTSELPKWTTELYQEIKTALRELPALQ